MTYHLYCKCIISIPLPKKKNDIKLKRKDTNIVYSIVSFIQFREQEKNARNRLLLCCI